MRNSNQKPNFYIAEKDKEFYMFLKEKLSEEIKEFFTAKNKEDQISEMGDINSFINFESL